MFILYTQKELEDLSIYQMHAFSAVCIVYVFCCVYPTVETSFSPESLNDKFQCSMVYLICNGGSESIVRVFFHQFLLFFVHDEDHILVMLLS